MANERREGMMEDNKMEETNKTVSAPKGVDTVKVIGKMKRKEMQKLRDAKKEVMVEDSSPENQTLEEHDRRHHPDGYKEGDTCKFRENIKTETETDQADVLSPNNPPQTQNQEQAEESREKGEEESEAEKPLKLRVPTEEEKDTNLEEVEEVEEETTPPQEEENSEKGIEVAGEESDLTPEDKEYLEAVNKGDMETAQRMVQEAAKKEYDVDNVQYHMGTLGTLNDKGMSYVIEDNDEGFHIGTLGAATERWSDVINMDDNYEIKVKKDKSGKYKGEFVVNGRVMLSTGAEYDSENDADWETGILLHEALKDESKAKEIIEAGGKKLHKLYVKRGIKMKELPDVAELGEKEWKGYIEEAKKEGYDGIRYKNAVEDVGSESIIIWDSKNIKSAEPITYDDKGNVIPLSKRFNNKEDDIRYSKTTKPQEEGTDKGFGEEFWGSREGKRIKGYAQKYGAAIDEEKQSAQNGYAANFNESGKYKMPLADGKFSKDFLKRVRGEDVWDKKDREEAEAAGKLLNNILGNVTIEFSDKPYEGGNSDSRKSIVVDEKTDAEYLEAVNKGDMGAAQRMVREAAARAGYDVFAYHGTKGDFTVFDKEKIGSANDEGYLGRGFYFWSENNLPYAYQYAGAGGKVMQVYLKVQEPHFIEREELESLIAASDRHDTEYIVSFTRDLKNNGYDSVVDDNGQILVFDSNAIKSADPVTYDDKGNVIPLSQRFNMDNPDIRYMTSQGKVVGEYDRKNGKITLYPGAKVKDVVHEYAHGLWQFAEQEAKEGRTTLRDKFHKIAKAAPTAVKKAVGEAYKVQGPGVIMEECFTHELARKSEQNQEFAKAIKTASGKSWYKRAWRTIKDTWGGLARKMGYGKADIDKMENMNAHESAEYILKQMAQGKHFGYINPTPDGGGKRKSISGIYTGSAADYDKPSLLKVGTGEGNQVYGWGLYGTNVRGVAEKYAMPSGLEIRRHGNIVKPWNDKIAGLIRNNFSSRNPIESALKEAKENGWDQKDIESLENGDYEVIASHSNLYEQTFFTDRAPGDESHLLKWYSSERPRTLLKKIRSNLTEEQANTFNKMYNKAYRSGPGGSAQAVFNQDIYEMLTDILGSQKDATEFLRDKCDIDGIKYPVDSYSGPIRDGDKDGWNYVSFRDDNIKVDRKWKDGEEVELNKEDK